MSDIVERLRESGNWAMACSVDLRDAQDEIMKLRREKTALRSELDALKKENEWQDIETAPKDGKTVLDLCGHYPTSKKNPKLRCVPKCKWMKTRGYWKTSCHHAQGDSMAASNFIALYWKLSATPPKESDE